MSNSIAQKNSPDLLKHETARSLRERVARLLDRTVFASLLVLLLLIAIPYGSADAWWHAIFECAVFVLAALWIFESLLRGAWFVGNHRLLLPLVALLAFMFVQSLPLWSGVATTRNVAGVEVWTNVISSDPFETRLTAFRLIALTLAAMLWLRYTNSQKRLRALVYCVIGVAVLSAMFGILRQTTQGDAQGFILPSLIANSGYAQFSNRNHFAFLMEMALGLVFGLVAGGGVRHDRVLIYLAAALPVWIGLVLSNSRGGIFSMLCQIAFIALLFGSVRYMRRASDEDVDRTSPLWRLSKSLMFRVVLIGSLLAMTFVGVLWVGGEPLAARLEGVQTELGSESDTYGENVSRKEIWRASWEMFRDHPIAGVGFGAYWAATPEYHRGSGARTVHQAHNDYLEIAASGGLIGVALVLAFFILFIKYARRSLRAASDPFQRAACFGALAGLFAVCIHSLVDFGLHITVNALVFTALVAIAAGTRADGVKKTLLESGKTVDSHDFQE